MKVIDKSLDKIIANKLREKADAESLAHKSSGKLSASMLNDPVQWQILKIIGVPRMTDDYALKKFERGKDVERFVVDYIPNLTEKQKLVQYKEVVGYVDALAGGIPHEVKSVTNLKFKRIESTKEADKGHRLQATLYALAIGSDTYCIDYVASDDYRVFSITYDVSETRGAVEMSIMLFEDQMKLLKVPCFESKEDWQKSLKYNPYPEFMDLSEHEIEALLDEKYPQALKNLQNRGEK